MLLKAFKGEIDCSKRVTLFWLSCMKANFVKKRTFTLQQQVVGEEITTLGLMTVP